MEEPTPTRSWPRLAALLALVGLGALVVPPCTHLATTALREAWATAPRQAGLHDYGGFDRMRPSGVVTLQAPLEKATIQARDALREAERQGLSVSIAGAKHSSGGQTLNPTGIYIDTASFRCVSYDPATTLVTVCAGTTWLDILEVLAPEGRAVKVMQSNSDFSVGGTLSVNAHGWQNGSPPVASTVRSMQVLTANGEVVRASREHNAELFRHVLGGYGLFGIILEATLETAPDTVYQAEQEELDLSRLAARWAALEAAGAELMYARLSLAADERFQNALLVSFSPTDASADAPPPANALEGLPRWVFRGQARSEYGKKLRYFVEREVGGGSLGTRRRSDIQRQPAHWFLNRDASRADALHEYFVPREQLPAFLAKASTAIDDTGADLLNITIRAVSPDVDSALPYAREEVFAAVMFFEDAAGPAGDERQRELARRLIDAAIDEGGSFYLPYRRHASPAQFDAAYPDARAFFEAKDRLDPQWRFSNYWGQQYRGGADTP